MKFAQSSASHNQFLGHKDHTWNLKPLLADTFFTLPLLPLVTALEYKRKSGIKKIHFKQVQHMVFW